LGEVVVVVVENEAPRGGDWVKGEFGYASICDLEIFDEFHKNIFVR